MGANQQTSVPAFTAGQVLTAQQQTEINTGVPVFADTTARDAAFGGTGEKVLAEGQLCYLENSNVVQYYDGSSWATVGPATAGALTFITSASFTTAATVSMAASTFTSTYQNYLVLVNFTASSTDQTVSIRVNNAGTPRTAANYYGSKTFTDSASTVAGTGTSAGTSHNASALRSAYPFGGLAITVVDPVSASTKTAWHGTAYGANNAATVVAAGTFGCFYDATEANDGLTFLVGGTITGNYRVYGYSNS